MIKFFIARVIAWFAGLKGSDFDKAVEFVKDANEEHSVSDDATDDEKEAARQAKREMVSHHIRQILPRIATFALNLLMEMEVAWVKKKGLQ